MTKPCDNINNREETIEELILRVINEKTGLVFLKPDHELSYFVPRSLRELRGFLMFLNSLTETKDKNLLNFKDYFLRSWCNDNLENEFIQVINSWLELDYSQRNKYFITASFDLLSDKFSKRFTNSEKGLNIGEVLEWYGIYSTSVKEISDKHNVAINVSFGDTLLAFKQLEKINDAEINKYCFAVKVLYSIEMLNLLNYSFFYKNDIKKYGEEKVQKAEEYALNELLKIIGGQFIPENLKYLPVIDENHIGYDIFPREITDEIEEGTFLSRQSFNFYYRDFYFTKEKLVEAGIDNDTEEMIYSKEDEIVSFNDRLKKYKKDLGQFHRDPNRIALEEKENFFDEEGMLLFQFFIIHLGNDDYTKRRKEEDYAYYNQRLSYGLLREKAKFDIFAFFWTSLFPEKIWERNYLPKGYEFRTIFKSMIENRRKGNILFPIYSIDLINKLFVKENFLYMSSDIFDWDKAFVLMIDDLYSEIKELGYESIIKESHCLKDIKYQELFSNLFTDIKNNRITETRKEELLNKVNDYIRLFNIERLEKLNSFNVNINTMIREIIYLAKNEKDKKILDPIVKKINSCKIKMKDVIPNSTSRAIVNSRNETQIDIDFIEKRAVIEDFADRLKHLFNE